MQSIAEHLDAALSADTGWHVPFRVHVFKPFADDVYQEILERLPDSKFYRQLPHRDALREDGSSTRLVLMLKDERIDELPGALQKFWRVVSFVLKGIAVKEVFRKHMAAQLQKRFSEIPLADIPLHPALLLLRDFAGYKINPHPDSADKVITCQMYLPDDASQRSLGTSFYRKTDSGEFERERMVEHVPNQAYAFTVTRHSWHGCDFAFSSNKPRNSMMLIYYQKPYDDY